MKPSRRARASVLARLQLGLEALYRVETRLAIDAFIIDEEARDAFAPARAPREQLLAREVNDALELALYLDRGTLANLERNDPAAGLDDRNFGDFCLAVEGVSHFIYLSLAARSDRPVSQLELELQAEVDKFACGVLLLQSVSRTIGAAELRRRLYGDVRYQDDLNAEEISRYRTANLEARRYAAALERRFPMRAETDGMLAELRGFYRMTLAAKLGHIARVS
jgi:hypothetical protein